ncbi:MAG: guanylate kinase [bacterium]|nr:guanylate kinase [bacterium]
MNSIIVISGPSGSGKSTLIHRLLKKRKDIIFSTSHTTRVIRDGETEGEDYYFISKEQFLEKIKNNEFVEWAQVYQYYYGTSIKEVESKASLGKSLILDIDVQGAKSIKEKFPDALLIFVTPPSLDELRRRLVGREKVLNANITKRLQIAEEEIRQYKLYDYIVVNDDLEQAYSVLDAMYVTFRNSVGRHAPLLEQIIKTGYTRR